MTADFHLIALELGSEDRALEQAVRALDELDEGETAFLSESLAWTPLGSARVFGELLALARGRRINIVTTLNLGPELLEDLPGRDEDERYNAVVIFTRHGEVHAPQAKLTPQPYERNGQDANEPGVGAYRRLNLVTLDIDGELVGTRFLVGSDLWTLVRHQPRELSCDLLVALGGLPAGAEERATEVLGRALAHGVAETAIHVNGYHNPRLADALPLAIKVEEVLDSTRTRHWKKWRSPVQLRDAFYVYRDGRVTDFDALCTLRREGRIPVPRSSALSKDALGLYPITITL